MKPILFSTPMVRAILNTKPSTWPPEPIDPAKPFKWMTRRVIKPQPDITHNLPVWRFRNTKTGKETKCPYGPPGTVLWVRETWCKQMGGYIYKATDIDKKFKIMRWRPSIHMPREAARLFLTVKDIRVERLQDISDDDCWAEGIDPKEAAKLPYINKFGVNCARAAFSNLWDSINGKKYIIHEWEDDDGVIHKEKIEASYPWESNPYVWVVSFMRTERPVVR